MLPDWLQPSILLFPAMLWMFLGLGLPWALAILPRSEWRHRLTVLAAALALGPALMTTIMFIIGTFGQFSAAGLWFGSGILALIGLGLALRQRPDGAPTPRQPPYSAVDVALVVVIAAAVLLRFWNTAYWPFTTYDALWVYGYNARLFMLHNAIPPTVGYYPQLLPLAYTYGQLVWGGIDDHAARVVLPYFAMGSILMAYVLGARLFNRRTGLLTAAIWALYPHHAVWSQFGDLEVTLTLYFAGTVAFFALGWREGQPRYILLSGLMLGAALWTKPTAGALIQSIGLLGVLGAAGRFLAARQWGAPRAPDQGRAVSLFRAALLALAAAFPMGGMWYIRNVLYGHPPLVFPAGYWQDEAQRSGQELGWLLLIAAAGVLWLASQRRAAAARLPAGVAGLALFAAGSLPSAFGGRLPTGAEWSQMLLGQIVPAIKPTPLGLPEIALISAGAALLLWAAAPVWRVLPWRLRGLVLIITLSIAPYFVTWFWSYSYHFRLSFPVVPLLAVLLAALLDASLRALLINRLRVAAVTILITALALPGLWAVLTALEPAATGALPDDDMKIALGNPALMDLVTFLRQRREELGRPLRVIAPGEQRLSFFFPLDDIRGDVFPKFLDEIAAVDYYIDSSVGHRLYALRGEFYNQIIASRTRENAMRRVFTTDDGNFRFSAYTIDNAGRFARPNPNGRLNVQVGDFAFLWGHDLSTLAQYPGQHIYLTLWWEALKPADLDYSIFIHLWDPANERLIAAWGGEPVDEAYAVWQGVPGAHFNVAYHTRLWQRGEIIADDRRLRLPEDAPPGHYELHVGLFDPIGGARLPITRAGVPIGESIVINEFDVLGPG